MDKLKDRYFIRVKHKGRDIAERLPLANRQTLLRIFVHFLLGKSILSRFGMKNTLTEKLWVVRNA